MIHYNDLIGLQFDDTHVNGLDCYELLRMAYKKHDVFIPETNISVCACTHSSNKEIQDNVIQYWEKINKPENPCGILIRSSNPNFANHIGFYIGRGKMLHITKNSLSMVESIHPKYTHRILGYYKFIG